MALPPPAIILHDQEYMCDRLAPNPKQGSFGVAPRDTQGPDAFGPGPGHYHLKTCVGDTFRFSMRGRETFGNPTGKSDDPTTATEPGPGQYPKAGTYLHSAEPAPPKFSVPRAKRPGLNKVDRGNRAGPGKPLIASCGKQVESRKTTEGFATFGSSVRKSLDPGGSDAGPGEYEYRDGMGDQMDSRFKSAARPTMKGVGRDKAPIGSRLNTDQGPGPQQYVLQSANTACIKTMTRSAYAYGKTAPNVRMSGRTKFGDPFAKWG